MNVQREIYIVNLVKKSIVRHCFNSVYDIATEAVDLCQPKNKADMDVIMEKIDVMNDYIGYIYDILELEDDDSEETIIEKDEIELSQEEADGIFEDEKKTSKKDYVDELNKTYDDFLHYSRLEEMRKGEGENPNNWKVTKDEI